MNFETKGAVEPDSDRAVLLLSLELLIPLLGEVENPAVKPQGRSPGGGRRAFAPSAARLDAVQLSDDVHTALLEASRTIMLPSMVCGDVERCQALRACPTLDVKGAEPVFRYLDELEGKVRRLVCPPLPSMVAGLCPNPDCGRLIRVSDGDTTALCRSCGQKWNITFVRADTHRRMLEDTTLMTSGQLVSLLGKIGLKRSRKTIQSWKQKGLLTPVIDVGNKPMYRVCDVYRLAVGNGKETK